MAAGVDFLARALERMLHAIISYDVKCTSLKIGSIAHAQLIHGPSHPATLPKISSENLANVKGTEAFGFADTACVAELVNQPQHILRLLFRQFLQFVFQLV